MDRDLSAIIVAPSASIRDAIACMDGNNAKVALVVDSESRLLDTVTDGDVRRALLAGETLDAPVTVLRDRKVTSPHAKPITAPTQSSHSALLRLMQDGGVRHIPLTGDGDRVVGLVTLDELLPTDDLPVRALVMAGGYGTRLRPLTEDLPKPMLPVGDRPVLELIVEQLRHAGIKKVHLSTHYKAEIIEQHFRDGDGFGVDIEYVEEHAPLGTAGAVGLIETTDLPLLVINGDIVTRVDFQAMLDFHQEHRAAMTVAVREHQLQFPYGVVDIDGTEVVGIREKPVMRQFINAGIYLLNPEVCRFIPPGQPYDMPDVIDRLLKEHLSVVSFPVHEYWLDIGHHPDYQQAQVDSGESRARAG